MTIDGRPRAAIYVRVSGELQGREGTSLDTQEERCRAFALSQGWTVAELFREVFTGARLYERPELSRFREMLRQGAFDIFVVYDADRFSRNQTHVALLEEALERAGAELWFAKGAEKFQNSAIGKFILNAKVFAAEIEREQIIERTQRGKRARVEEGRLFVGRCPLYGYEWNADKTAYVVDPVAAPNVRRIFAAAMSGRPLRAIALDLNREGVPSPHNTAVRAAVAVYGTQAPSLTCSGIPRTTADMPPIGQPLRESTANDGGVADQTPNRSRCQRR
jgi:DNA invertase Pin-like site-specific DNA recombinase